MSLSDLKRLIIQNYKKNLFFDFLKQDIENLLHNFNLQNKLNLKDYLLNNCTHLFNNSISNCKSNAKDIFFTIINEIYSTFSKKFEFIVGNADNSKIITLYLIILFLCCDKGDNIDISKKLAFVDLIYMTKIDKENSNTQTSMQGINKNNNKYNNSTNDENNNLSVNICKKLYSHYYDIGILSALLINIVHLIETCMLMLIIGPIYLPKEEKDKYNLVIKKMPFNDIDPETINIYYEKRLKETNKLINQNDVDEICIGYIFEPIKEGNIYYLYIYIIN